MTTRHRKTISPIEPHAHLSGAARAEWERIAPALVEQGIAEGIDRALLETYCVSYARYREAETQIVATGGGVVHSPQGGLVANPWVSISRAANRDMRAALDALNLTPYRRNKRKGDDGGNRIDLGILSLDDAEAS